MMTILAVGAEIGVLAAIAAGFQLVMLAFRNPFRPAWLGGFGLDTFAALAFAIIAAVGIGSLVAGLMAAGANFPGAVGLTAVVVVGLTMGAAWLLQTKKRLSLADSGMSPFRRLPRKLPGAELPVAPAA